MQTSYSRYMDPAIAGTLYDISFRRVDSYAVETDDVYPGFGVILGTDKEKQVKLAAATTAVVAGIALLQAKEQDENGNVIYKDEQTVPVLNKGRAWVPVIEAVTAGNGAFLVFSGANKGKWAAAAGAGPIASAITGAKFITSTTGAGLAVVELN
jgi:hypothetical protein